MASSPALSAELCGGAGAWRRWCSAAVLVAAAALLATAPLFLQPNLPRGDDVGEHVQFVQDFTDGLREGRLYPRWLAHTNLGYGAPVFLFYPPLATAVVAVLHVAHLSLFGAFRAGCLLLTLGGAAAGAVLGRALPGDPRCAPAAAAIVGALTVLLPYHAVDIFDRFALAETATFMFVPLLLLGLERPQGRRLLLVAAAFAGLCLAHLPTAYLAAMVSVAWVLARHHRRLPAVACMLLLGGACAAVYVVPAVAERPWVHADWLESNPAYRFDAHYLFFPRPLDLVDPIHGRLQGSLDSPTRDRVRWVAPLTLLLALAAWGLRRWRRRAGDLTGEPLDRYAILAVASLAGMTRLADPLWRLLPGLASVVFPWRLTLFLTVATAVLVGTTAAELFHAPARSGRRAAAGILVAGLMLATLASWCSVRAADWSTFTVEYAQQRPVRLRVAGAFMPRSNPHMRGFGARPPAGPPRLLTAAGEPAGRVMLLARENHRLELLAEVDHPAGALLDVDVFDYPGWRAQVNGVPVAHRRAPALGTLRLPLAAGRHRVEWTFGSTRLRTAAAAVSALALATLLSLTLLGTGRTMGRWRRS